MIKYIARILLGGCALLILFSSCGGLAGDIEELRLRAGGTLAKNNLYMIYISTNSNNRVEVSIIKDASIIAKPGETSAKAPKGDLVQIRAIPDVGNKFSGWDVPGVDLNSSADPIAEFVMPGKNVNINVYFEPLPDAPYLQISPSSVTFDAVNVGYQQLLAYNVTVTNWGLFPATDVSITLTGAGAGSFLLDGHEGITSLASSQGAIFTIQPYEGLMAGTYEADITISYNTEYSATAHVTFVVNSIVVPTSTVNINGKTPQAASSEIQAALDAGYNVTVVGKIDKATMYIEINIPANRKVFWHAEFIGTLNGPIVRLDGPSSAEFSIEDGIIQNENSTGIAIDINSQSTNVSITVNGGRVESGRYAITVKNESIVKITNGTVIGRRTISISDFAILAITGGTVTGLAGGLDGLSDIAIDAYGYSTVYVSSDATINGKIWGETPVTGYYTGDIEDVFDDLDYPTLVISPAKRIRLDEYTLTADGSPYIYDPETPYEGTVTAAFPNLTVTNIISGGGDPLDSSQYTVNPDKTVSFAGNYHAPWVYLVVSGTIADGRLPVEFGILPSFGLNLAVKGLFINYDTAYTDVTAIKTAIENALVPPSNSTVTVSGKLDGVTETLFLNIPAGKKVQWEADYSGNCNSSLIELKGHGELNIDIKGKLHNDQASVLWTEPDSDNTSALTVNIYGELTSNGPGKPVLQFMGGNVASLDINGLIQNFGNNGIGLKFCGEGSLLTMNGGIITVDGDEAVALFIDESASAVIKGGTVQNLFLSSEPSCWAIGVDNNSRIAFLENTIISGSINVSDSTVFVNGGTIEDGSIINNEGSSNAKGYYTGAYMTKFDASFTDLHEGGPDPVWW